MAAPNKKVLAMITLSSICVYCGSNKGGDPAYAAEAARLGGLMAEAGVRLVFGGGRVGIMGILADAVLAGGGEVTGIIPKHLSRVEVAHAELTEIIVTDSMHSRKQKMFERSDGFAVLPGGLGTLDETFEIITWKQLGLHDKPIVLVDSGGFWRPLLDLVDHVIDQGFAKPAARDYFTVIPSVDAVIPALSRAPEPRIAPQPERL